MSEGADSSKLVRVFDSGATRSADTGKPDYEGYLSPLVIREFGKYMTRHRHLPDGSMRDSDNWQRGIPREQYIKSLFRHFMDLWVIHRGYEARDHAGNIATLYETLSALLFNTQGYFHETIKANGVAPAPVDYEYEEARRLSANNGNRDTVGLGNDGLDGVIVGNAPVNDPRKVDLLTLLYLDCPTKIAEQISAGFSYSQPSKFRRVVYIAGPMRGLPAFNFPAFDAARDQFVAAGYDVISPADIDRQAGDENSDNQLLFCLRDFFSLFYLRAGCPMEGGSIAMLPGWEKSVGASAEFLIARWLGIVVLDSRTMQPLNQQDIKTVDLLDSIRKFLVGQINTTNGGE